MPAAFNISALNIADYVILGIIASSILISLMRGFVREALSLLTWIIAFIIAFKFGYIVASYFTQYFQNQTLRTVISFGLIFIIVLILGALMNFFVSSFVSKTGLGGLDTLLGVVFGILRGVLLVAVIILLGTMTNLTKEAWWQNSILIPYFGGIVSWLHSFLPNKITGFHSVNPAIRYN